MPNDEVELRISELELLGAHARANDLRNLAELRGYYGKQGLTPPIAEWIMHYIYHRELSFSDTRLLFDTAAVDAVVDYFREVRITLYPAFPVTEFPGIRHTLMRRQE